VVSEQLQLTFDPVAGEAPRPELAVARERPVTRVGLARRPPRGIHVGDVVVAERSRWTVLALDPERGEFVCRLIGGSAVLRRFRIRAVKVERGGR
jgi:hypothetical protein